MTDATGIVNQRAAARWRRGHPWLYASDVVRKPGDEPGAVLVYEEHGGLLGRALWSPRSTISLRMLTSDDTPMDAAFWRQRISAAIAYRRALAPQSNAYRLVHAEADGLPSLVVDKYADVLVAQFLSAGLECFRADITAALVDCASPAGVLARNDVPVRTYEGLDRSIELLYGTVPEEIEVAEGKIRYLAAPWSGQKTGAFLDQRENRMRAGELSRGRALDCFAYHGSFAMHLAARADSVVAIDSSAEALARSGLNASLNGFTNVEAREANVFDFLRAEENAGAEYDVVVVDPPAFAKRRDALKQALGGYKEVNLRAMRLLKPGGHLCTFSCSYHVDTAAFREMLMSAAADAGRPMRWIETRAQSSDHPQLMQVPETSYLKGAILQAV